MFEDGKRDVKEKMPLQKNCRTIIQIILLHYRFSSFARKLVSGHTDKMKNLFLICAIMVFSPFVNASSLPTLDFKEAKNMEEETKVFIQRLVRYTCDGALTHASSKNFIPKIYDYSAIRGKNNEYSFRLAFDRADNHAEFIVTKKANGETMAYIPKDTRDGLCLLGKFYLRDIESYETHLEP